MSGRFTVTNLVAFVFLVPFAVAVAQTQPTAVQSASATPQFHGTYEELKPQQKQLIDEWYADYNKLTGDHADPKEYNQVSLSTLTTSYVGSWMTITMALRNMCRRVAMRA